MPSKCTIDRRILQSKTKCRVLQIKLKMDAFLEYARRNGDKSCTSHIRICIKIRCVLVRTRDSGRSRYLAKSVLFSWDPFLRVMFLFGRYPSGLVNYRASIDKLFYISLFILKCTMIFHGALFPVLSRKSVTR